MTHLILENKLHLKHNASIYLYLYNNNGVSQINSFAILVTLLTNYLMQIIPTSLLYTR